MAKIIINENQLHLIKEANNLYNRAENIIRGYLKSLVGNSDKKPSDFFTGDTLFKQYNVNKKDFDKKLTDIGMISVKNSITEPLGGDGKKYSHYGMEYTVYNKNFNDNLDKLIDTFFNKSINECTAGAAVGGGASTTFGAGDYSFTAPALDKPLRRDIYKTKTGDVTKQTTNTLDSSDALSRDTKKGISMRRKK